MSFCPNCGKKIEGEVTFCPSCGFNLKEAQKSSSPTSSPGKGRIVSEGGLNTRTYMIISVAGLGALALLSLMMGDSLGFIISAALTGVVGFAVVVMGKFFGVVDILVAIPIFMTWNELEKSWFKEKKELKSLLLTIE